MRLQSGGLIGCAGFDLQSNIINLFTLGLPGISIHHVGIVCEYDGEPLIYESTKSARPPCVRTGQRVSGVQAHTFEEMRAIPFYNALWYYPLRRELYLHERERLRDYLESVLRTPYDMDGACQSGGIMLAAISALLCGENLASLFCSELCMSALVRTGVCTTPDASRWSPNKLCRNLVRSGICERPIRVR
jgi:hypothetical protein